MCVVGREGLGLGRPIEINSSNQIGTLIENNQCYTTREIADILKISKSMKLLVKMKSVSFILQKKKKKQSFWPTDYLLILSNYK